MLDQKTKWQKQFDSLDAILTTQSYHWFINNCLKNIEDQSKNKQMVNMFESKYDMPSDQNTLAKKLISLYTGDFFYKRLNQVFRNFEINHYYLYLGKLIHLAIHYLQNKGNGIGKTDIFVYRGVPQNVFMQYINAQQPFYLNGFMSTSKNNGQGIRRFGDYTLILNLKNFPNAVDLGSLSQEGDDIEAEVLLDFGSLVKVIAFDLNTKELTLERLN